MSLESYSLAGALHWIDDTHMALSIVECLEKYGRIDQDELAGMFARRYKQDPRQAT